MAMILDVENYLIGTGQDRFGHVLIKLKDTLVARGWTVEGSGDGQSVFARNGQTAGPYDVFTSGTGYYVGGGEWSVGGANTISNTNAWMILREPAPSTRELLLQRSSSTASNNMLYLHNLRFSTSGFVQSGCSATVVNVNTVVANTSYNRAAATTTLVWGNGTAETALTTDQYYLQILVSDSARGDNVWPFYMWCWNTVDNNRGGEWVYESLVQAPGNERWIAKFGYGDATASVFALATNQSAETVWYGRNEATLLPATNIQFSRIYFLAAAYAIPGNWVTSQIPCADGDVRGGYPFIFNAADFSYKGISEHWTFNPRNRDYPSTIDVATPNAKISLGCAILPWKQNVVPSF